jgi:hypothetical protein
MKIRICVIALWTAFVLTNTVRVSLEFSKKIGMSLPKTSKKLIMRNGLNWIKIAQFSALMEMIRQLTIGVEAMGETIDVTPNPLVEIGKLIVQLFNYFHHKTWEYLYAACKMTACNINYMVLIIKNQFAWFTGKYYVSIKNPDVELMCSDNTTLLLNIWLLVLGIVLSISVTWLVVLCLIRICSKQGRNEIKSTLRNIFSLCCRTSIQSRLVSVPQFGEKAVINGVTYQMIRNVSSFESVRPDSNFVRIKKLPKTLCRIVIGDEHVGMAFRYKQYLILCTHTMADLEKHEIITLISQKGEYSFVFSVGKQGELFKVHQLPIDDVSVISLPDNVWTRLGMSSVKPVKIGEDKFVRSVRVIGPNAGNVSLIDTSIGIANFKEFGSIEHQASTIPGFSGTALYAPLIKTSDETEYVSCIGIHHGRGHNFNRGTRMDLIALWLDRTMMENSHEFFLKWAKEHEGEIRHKLREEAYEDDEGNRWIVTNGKMRGFVREEVEAFDHESDVSLRDGLEKAKNKRDVRENWILLEERYEELPGNMRNKIKEHMDPDFIAERWSEFRKERSVDADFEDFVNEFFTDSRIESYNAEFESKPRKNRRGKKNSDKPTLTVGESVKPAPPIGVSTIKIPVDIENDAKKAIEKAKLVLEKYSNESNFRNRLGQSAQAGSSSATGSK